MRFVRLVISKVHNVVCFRNFRLSLFMIQMFARCNLPVKGHWFYSQLYATFLEASEELSRIAKRDIRVAMDLAKASPKFTEWMWSEKVVKSLDFGELAASGKFPMAKELLTTSIMNMLSLSIIRYLLESYAFRPIFSRHFKSANVSLMALFR